ncbi:unnamed protein product [Dovyalis caffra]|uniref:Uncharacterized protein n=1 Tax=Dovyalis caffra TaxID=77055 RepID=A0AAV1SUR4_9ROSI|nr:unnamed protein product [Dovyalis caffra]
MIPDTFIQHQLLTCCKKGKVPLVDAPISMKLLKAPNEATAYPFAFHSLYAEARAYTLFNILKMDCFVCMQLNLRM